MDIQDDEQVVANTSSPFYKLPLLGYYYGDGKYGDYFSQWSSYANLYHCWARMAYSNYGTEPNSLWRQRMAQGLARAYAEGKYIALALNMQDPQDTSSQNIAIVLDKVAPYWDKVQFIDIADEPKWDKSTTKQMLAKVRGLISERGLSAKPLGMTYFTDRLSDEFNATNNECLTIPPVDSSGRPKGPDFVGLECYCPAPGSQNFMENNSLVKQNVRSARGRLHPDTKVVLIGQGYSRNGLWTDENTLVKLQNVPYKLALESDRTLALLYFSYGRKSGTFEHPRLQQAHKDIAKNLGLMA